MKKMLILVSSISVVIAAGIIAYIAFANSRQQPVQTAIPLPASVGVIGDSISVGASTEKRNTSTPKNNWASGSNSTVNSVVSRLSRANSGRNIEVSNVARAGDSTKSLATQVKKVNADSPELVMILIGANDICGSGVTFDTMTSTDVFQSRFREALRTIKPDSDILVFSIVNLQSLYDAGATNVTARTFWSKSGACPALLANVGSDAAADLARRAGVTDQIAAYNTAINTECAQLTNCTYDQGALYKTDFTINDISTHDYFHPSIDGQAKIAEVAWGSIRNIYGF